MDNKNWELIFEGDVKSDTESFNDGIFSSGAISIDAPILNGDMVRYTIDGVTETSETTYDGMFVYCGNRHLADLEYEDNGGDFAIRCYPSKKPYFSVFSRLPGTYHIRIEVTHPAPIDKASFMQGYIVGRRLAGMRK